MVKFVFPCEEHKQQATEYIQEFYDHSARIHGTGGLDFFLKDSDYSDWLKNVRAFTDIANIPEGKVPGHTYFYVREDDGRIVGMINIRLALNDFLRNEGGHIGYSIRPTEWRKGYGTQMLREALLFCRKIIAEDIIVTCDKVNISSAGVIKNCGGILDAEFYSESFKDVIQRYLIK